MTDTQNFLELYNPLGALSLNDEDLQGMQNLTTAQIKDLATAYPNQPRGNNYLVLINKSLPANKQVYQLSTWNNLHVLHTLGKKEFAAYSFKSVFTSPQFKRPVAKAAKEKTVVVDLSKEDVAGAPGIKSNIPDAINPDTTVTAPVVVTTTDNPELDAPNVELTALELELQAAKDDKAHHMTIKSIESKIEAAKEKIAATENKTVA